MSGILSAYIEKIEIQEGIVSDGICAAGNASAALTLIICGGADDEN